MARPEVTRKFVVGLFCGGAFHEVAFTPGWAGAMCDVVRLCDWELRTRKVSRSLFPEEGVVRDMDIRAGNVGVLEAGISLVVPTDGWLHLNAQCGASLPGWQQGKPTTGSSALARARRNVLHCGTAVACEEPEGGIVRRERGMCGVHRHNEGAVPGRKVRSGGPCLIQCGAPQARIFCQRGVRPHRADAIDGHLHCRRVLRHRSGPWPVLDAQRLLRFIAELRLALHRPAGTDTDVERVAHAQRAHRLGVARCPSDDTAKLRSLAALPKSTTADVTARRCAVAMVVDGKVLHEVARQLGAMHHDGA